MADCKNFGIYNNDLTVREAECLHYVDLGLENKEIGEVDLLHVIDKTVTPFKEDVILKFITVSPKYRNQKIGKTILNKVFEDIKRYEKQNHQSE